MSYFGASLNQSSVLAEKAGEDITNGAFLVVKYNEEGKIIINDTAGGIPAGVLLPETPDVKKDDDVTIQIKDIGYVKAGGTVKKGAEVTADNKGCIVSAASGDFILGFALDSAEAEGEIIKIDIRKCGYKAGSANDTAGSNETEQGKQEEQGE